MSEHTPGPWNVDDSLARDGGEFGIAILAPYGRMQHVRIADMPPGEVGDETRANATLIAAAPDLLAALRGLLDSLCDSDIDDLEDHDLGQGHDAAGCVLCEARAAIARATGE